MKVEIKEFLGNRENLKLKKIAFLCSRKIPASVVLKCYDWAIEQREKGNCVISGLISLRTGGAPRCGRRIPAGNTGEKYSRVPCSVSRSTPNVRESTS
jgi:hypothetical protein